MSLKTCVLFFLAVFLMLGALEIGLSLQDLRNQENGGLRVADAYREIR